MVRRHSRETQNKKSVKFVVGDIHLHHDGYGFVIAKDADIPDIFIPARGVGYALHGDTVEVQVMPGRRGGASLEGRVLKILSHGLRQMVGRFERCTGGFCVIADDLRVRQRMKIPNDLTGGAHDGQTVVALITEYPANNKQLTGRVIEVLGVRGGENVEAEIVAARRQLPRGFSKKVLEDTKNLCNRFNNAGFEKDRVDLRNKVIFTIDGENAKDFDDAVGVETCNDGAIRLFVSIADVSCFVSEGSAVDREAYERGTSVYFPHKCIPMLPPGLSEDVCSLKPSEDRFTVTAELLIGKDGRVVESDFYRSVIKSSARLTYTTVKKILIDKDESLVNRYRHLIPHLELMERLCRRIRERRIARGSIDFDLPEPEIVLDMEGAPEDIVRSERNIAHMIIEEFMIAANEAVAAFLTKKKSSCIYRVHGVPDSFKMREFEVMIHNLGYRVNFGKRPNPHVLARIVKMADGRPEMRLINTMLLRSMAQAVYSTDNIGHFGLASECYCHFTSPIRRYPDLIVHRLVLRMIENRGALKTGGALVRLGQMAEHLSRCERKALEAEREMKSLYAAIFMRDKVGMEFDGIISHVTKFGLFVELVDFFVEGLVHISKLAGDKYRFDEDAMAIAGLRHKKTYGIGKKVRVSVEGVSIERREIDFAICGHM